MSSIADDHDSACSSAVEHGPVPWRNLAPVLVPATVLLVGIFIAQRLTDSAHTRLVLDNAHWTLSYGCAALLAWIAVHHGSAQRKPALLWYAYGLTSYAIGQLLWDLQVATGWNPFPGPSDAFYLMLGVCCAVGVARDIGSRADASRRRMIALDAGGFLATALTVVLALYLPLRGNNSVFQMAVLVAYPLGLLTAACLSIVVLPVLCLRLTLGWALFAGGLTLDGVLWMKWNAMTLAGTHSDGTLYNACFSIGALVLGVGVARWDPTAVANHEWERRYEGVLRVMPLAAVVGASLALIAVFTYSSVPVVVKNATAFGAGVVFLMAVARQSALLHERDRMTEMEGQFRTLFDSAPDAILLIEGERIIGCNASAERLFGLPRQVLIGMTPVNLSPERQPDGRLSAEAATALVRGALAGEPQSFEWSHVRAGAGQFQADVALHRVKLPGRSLLQGVVRDITDRREAEAKHAQLEEKLRQASRMEAVGRLAGGVAHDFNNILTVILGTSELALTQHSSSVSMRAELEEIRSSAQRAAALTAQLLAFSRRQVIAPVPSDLNTMVQASLGMLRRLVGEDVELVFEPTEPIETVNIDRTQFDQILVNLVVNSRDAMPRGGRIVITTALVDRMPGSGIAADPSRFGRFVRLGAADNGAGIPAELLEHIFEPFFTTKELGQGTGLGLSTVYGIVEQNGGFIELGSIPGEGTRFDLFFPAVVGAPLAVASPGQELLPRGTETILMVEDDALVRDLARRMLAELGYAVLVASSGEEAIRLSSNPTQQVDLLLSDVIMPGMSGKEVYERLAAVRPGLRVVFTSGYAANFLAPHGILEQGLVLLHKPFTIGDLAVTVRGVLDRRETGFPLLNRG